MKEVEITVKCESGAHPVTAYADAKYPGLAIHGPWGLGENGWRVTHVASGLAVAILPTRAAATAALPAVAALQDWTRPLAEVAAHGEPGRNKYLRAYVAAAVERVNSDRAAVLQAAVDTGAVKGVALEAALGDFTCDKMGRHWRSRSPVTHGKWAERARKLLGPAAGLSAVGRLAAALYAAASDFSRNGNFSPVAWEPHTWKLFSGRLRTCRAKPPEKALSRGEYDAKRRATADFNGANNHEHITGILLEVDRSRAAALLPAADAERILAAARKRRPGTFADKPVRVNLNRPGTVWVQNVHYYGGEHFGKPYHFPAEITCATTGNAFSRCVNRLDLRLGIPFTYQEPAMHILHNQRQAAREIKSRANMAAVALLTLLLCYDYIIGTSNRSKQP